MLQLRESQPAVPQTVQITQNKLPTMTESDDLEAFVTQLEIAMNPQNKVEASHAYPTNIILSKGFNKVCKNLNFLDLLFFLVGALG